MRRGVMGQDNQDQPNFYTILHHSTFYIYLLGLSDKRKKRDAKNPNPVLAIPSPLIALGAVLT
jgi:hypothetical protein